MDKVLAADKRLYAISDVHGCYKSFLALLKKIKFNSNCVLYLLGDYIDRGPRSKEVLDWIMQHKNSVNVLKGNHEQMLLDSLLGPEMEEFWLYNGGNATLKSFGVERPADIPDSYINFLLRLKPYISYNDMVFVHGGINLHHEQPFRPTDTNHDQMLWDREAPEHSDIKMIVGHTPTSLHHMYQSLRKNKIIIDGGCAYDGYLVAYDINNNDIAFQVNIE